MFTKKKTVILFTIIALSFVFVSCSLGRQDGTLDMTNTLSPVPTGAGNSPVPTGNDAAPSPTDSALAVTPTESTPSPTPEVYLDTQSITGVQFGGVQKNGITRVLSMGYEVLHDGKYISNVQMLTNGQGKTAILYSESGNRTYEEDSTSEFFLLITALDKGRIRIEKKISLGRMYYSYISAKGDMFCINNNAEGTDGQNQHFIRMFDYDGNEQACDYLQHNSIPGTIYFSGVGDYFYQSDSDKHVINKVNYVTGDTTRVEYSEKLLIKSLYGVSTIKGKDYLSCSFMGTDLKEYEGVISAEGGEILYIRRDNECGYISCNPDYLTINSPYTEETGTISTVYNGDYTLQYGGSSDFSTGFMVLGDRIIVSHTDYESHDETFTDDEGNVYDYTVVDKTYVDIAVLDFVTGKVLTSNRVEIAGEKDPSNIVYVDDNKLMLTFSTQAEAMDVYFWDLDDRKYSDYAFLGIEELKALPFSGFTNPEIVGQYTREDFVPSACSDKFKELRQYADRLEKKYDITIHIAEEAKGIMSGYLFEMLNDTATLKNALDTMDTEFAKYPKGFFSLYKKLSSYPDGLELFFTGGLLGFEDGNLDRAGGLRTEDEDSINIALDAYDGRYEAAVHHELSHSIEVLIKNLGTEELDEDIWDGFNVKYGGERTYYTYSYSHQDSEWLYGYKDNYKYTYDSLQWKNKKQVLFTDDYAMTYPTEDRSRLFEKIMWDNFDISEYPALYDKFAYYSGLIKKMLVENGFEADAACYWEWVIKD